MLVSAIAALVTLSNLRAQIPSAAPAAYCGRTTFHPEILRPVLESAKSLSTPADHL